MSLELRRELFEQLDSIVLIDPHSHVNPLEPASNTLADILGYHYFTELAHSAGLPKAEIEAPGISSHEKVRRLVHAMQPLENTIQYSWFIDLARDLFGFQHDKLTTENWEGLFDAAQQKMNSPSWSTQVLGRSNIEAVFLTNDFDDPLQGFDTSLYIPCLRTDDLVFHFAKMEVRDRLERCANVSIDDLSSLHTAIDYLFHHFTQNNARACAISLPPDFSPTPVSGGRAKTALKAILLEGTAALESHKKALSSYIFWLLAEHCRAYHLPFDLMIGVNRGVYENGVYQGRDLYDSRVSLIQYKQLFNAFPEVTFPISVLASVTNQELTSYAWIFPNVVTNGHWWYSNTPSFIEHDLAARLEAIPQTKQIGYYSDMYKLEFGLPKFKMYKQILAKILAERFVQDRGWSESRAIELGKQILRGNVDSIFMRDRPAVNKDSLPIVATATTSSNIQFSTAVPIAVGAAVETFVEPEQALEIPEEPMQPLREMHTFAFTPEPETSVDEVEASHPFTFSPVEDVPPETSEHFPMAETEDLEQEIELNEPLEPSSLAPGELAPNPFSFQETIAHDDPVADEQSEQQLEDLDLGEEALDLTPEGEGVAPWSAGNATIEDNDSDDFQFPSFDDLNPKKK